MVIFSYYINFVSDNEKFHTIFHKKTEKSRVFSLLSVVGVNNKKKNTMKRNFFTAILALFLCIGMVSCDNDDDNTPSKMLIGTWQCVGFKDVKNNGVRNINVPKECKNCFTITFFENDSFQGSSEKNAFGGKYKTSGKKLEIKDFVSTLVDEFGDSEIFIDAIKVLKAFEIHDNKLYLFADDVCLVLETKNK